MTGPEVLLWSRLRRMPWKFRRQEPIDRYVVDFACYSHRLVVEVDGSQHADDPHDAVRDARLEDLGFKVLRFWNHQVLTDLDGVCETIRAIARQRPDLHRSRRPRGSPPAR